jgi:hypothetical protein
MASYLAVTSHWGQRLARARVWTSAKSLQKPTRRAAVSPGPAIGPDHHRGGLRRLARDDAARWATLSPLGWRASVNPIVQEPKFPPTSTAPEDTADAAPAVEPGGLRSRLTNTLLTIYQYATLREHSIICLSYQRPHDGMGNSPARVAGRDPWRCGVRHRIDVGQRPPL